MYSDILGISIISDIDGSVTNGNFEKKNERILSESEGKQFSV